MENIENICDEEHEQAYKQTKREYMEYQVKEWRKEVKELSEREREIIEKHLSVSYIVT